MGKGQGEWGMIANRHRVSFWDDKKKFSKIDSGVGYTTLNILKTLNYVF